VAKIIRRLNFLILKSSKSKNIYLGIVVVINNLLNQLEIYFVEKVKLFTVNGGGRTMKKVFCLTVILLAILLVVFSCQKSTDLFEPQSDNEMSSLAKKPENPGKPPKEDQQKYSVTLNFLPDNQFDLDASYYLNIPDATDPDAFYEAPNETDHIIIHSEIQTSSDFTSAHIAIFPDLDEQMGHPDGMPIWVYRVGVNTDNKIDNLYWWGQCYPNTTNQTIQETGRYLASIQLWRGNASGKHARKVFDSTDDPNFQTFDGIEHGYMPIYVN